MLISDIHKYGDFKRSFFITVEKVIKTNKQKKKQIRMAATIIILNRKVFHGIYSFEVL